MLDATHKNANNTQTTGKKAVVLFSGGLDSSTVLALACERGDECTALSFRYGQRHTIELERAALIARHFGVSHLVIDVNIGAFGGSSLTDVRQSIPTESIPTQSIPTQSIPANPASTTNPAQIPSTYVPARNTVFIALGLSLAESIGAEHLYLGINAVDYSGYPDCRPEYLEAYQRLANLATKAGLAGEGPKLLAPLIALSKVDIVREAKRLGVPIAQTYSCYQGTEQPCGVCESCLIRQKALDEAEPS